MDFGYKQFCFFVVLLGLDVGLESSSANIFPFVKNPELSWDAFEKNFREMYAHLDIPKFVLTDFFKSSAVYISVDDAEFPKELLNETAFKVMIQELQKEGNNEKLIESLYSLKGAVPPFIAIDLSKKSFFNWQEMAYVLLHEMGHYEYDKKGLHQKNHKQAQQAADIVSYGTVALVTLYNAYLASQMQWSGKAVLAQSIIMLLHSSSIIHSLFKDIFAVRAEEFIADDFANQHATKEVLLAGRYWCTVEHTLDWLSFNNPDIASIIQNPKNMTEQFALKMLRFFASLSCIDYTHPSNEQRIKRIDQALQDRFDVKI